MVHPRFRHRGTSRGRRSVVDYNWSRFQDDRGTNITHFNGNIARCKRMMTVRMEENMEEKGGIMCNPSTSVFGKIVTKMKMKNKTKLKDEITVDDDLTENGISEATTTDSDHRLNKSFEMICIDECQTPTKHNSSLLMIPSASSEFDADSEIEIIEEIIRTPPSVSIPESENTEDQSDIVCVGVIKKKKKSWLEEIINEKGEMNQNDIPHTSWSDTSTVEIPRLDRLTKNIDCLSNSLTILKNHNWRRLWESMESDLSNSKETALHSDFTICSYNVLCQKTMERTRYLYKHLELTPQFATWDYRWERLKDELPRLNADIIGLQEVQEDHYLQYYAPLMISKEYNGYFKQKFGGGEGSDGCAIFYRPAIFEELEYVPVNYFVNQTAILNRENIGQIVVLKCRNTGERLVVANTHLVFNGERGDVKLAQLAMLFANIHRIMQKYEKNDGNGTSLIIFGDFNIEPHSLIYNFIVNGEQFIHDAPIRTMSGQSIRDGGAICRAQELLSSHITGVALNSMFCETKLFPEYDGYLRHPFQFGSVHSHGQNRLERREISTFHKDAANPDFIFYSILKSKKKGGKRKKIETPNLQLLRRYSLPTMERLSETKPWPNEHVPSDHLPLLAKFRLIRPSS